jgi:hypothetical protein
LDNRKVPPREEDKGWWSSFRASAPAEIIVPPWPRGNERSGWPMVVVLKEPSSAVSSVGVMTSANTNSVSLDPVDPVLMVLYENQFREGDIIVTKDGEWKIGGGFFFSEFWGFFA